MAESSKRSSSRSSTRKPASAPKSTSARKSTSGRKSASGPASSAEGPELAGKAASELRDALAHGVTAPINFLILSRERIEEVMNDAVERGRVTADDAQSLVQSLVRRGARETSDVLRDLEQLLSRGRETLESSTSKARSRAAKTADPAIAQADRARRAAGLGPAFPIVGYDDLTAAQVQARLGDLTPPELRKVRDHEKRNANRKSVLDAIGKKLG